jgi:hypothetical protein
MEMLGPHCNELLPNCNEVFSGDQQCENGVIIQRFGDCLCLHHQSWKQRWRQTQSLKRWITTPFSHFWSPEKTSLHLRRESFKFYKDKKKSFCLSRSLELILKSDENTRRCCSGAENSEQICVFLKGKYIKYSRLPVDTSKGFAPVTMVMTDLSHGNTVGQCPVYKAFWTSWRFGSFLYFRW